MNVGRFKSTIKSVARPTLFEVEINGSSVASISSELLKYTCKASSLPSSTIGVIEVPYYGRKIKFAGDRTYAEWQTTIIGDNKWTIYNEIEKWHASINHPEENTSVTDAAENYKCDVLIRLYDEQGNTTKELTLIGAWPSEIQQLDLDWGNNDQTADIMVTWAFDYIHYS